MASMENRILEALEGLNAGLVDLSTKVESLETGNSSLSLRLSAMEGAKASPSGNGKKASSYRRMESAPLEGMPDKEFGKPEVAAANLDKEAQWILRQAGLARAAKRGCPLFNEKGVLFQELSSWDPALAEACRGLGSSLATSTVMPILTMRGLGVRRSIASITKDVMG